MRISEITIENYKGFSGAHKLSFKDNLIFFVGNNNTGKSSVFESIDFLKNGIPKGKSLKDLISNKATGPLSVTVKLQHDIKDLINNFSEKKYLPYVFDEDNIETMIARRSSENIEIIQNKKKVTLSIKKITLWNPDTKQFENPAGPDSVFSTLFEAQFVWADTNPDDIADFGTTKICGRLVSAAIGDFFETPLWNKFTAIHDETFHSGKDSLTSRTKTLEKEINTVIQDQYGPADVSFNFQLPEVSSFLKSGGINIDDGTDTNSKNKGTGLQRALALALIQIYATNLTKHPEDPKKTKPLFLFIDEPETFMHPQAQHKFLTALNTISKTRQVFVTTHSPYLLRLFDSSAHNLYIFSRSGDKNSAQSSTALSLFGRSSPTWGEINYYAYGMTSVEFHNELYGFVQAAAITLNPDNGREQDFDNYLVSKGLSKYKDWVREIRGAAASPEPRTLQTYIRNYIHHPENTNNAKYTNEELRESIEELIQLI